MTHWKAITSALAVCLALVTAPSVRAQSAQSADHAQPAETVNICALMRPQAGKAEALRDALLALVEPTRREAGHIAYDVYEEQDGALFLHEVWRSQQDLDRHLQQPYVVDFVNRMAGLLDGANEAHFGRVVSTLQNPRFTARDAQRPDAVNICSIKRPREGKADALRQALLALVEPTRREAGFITYNLYEEQDGTLFLYEAWRSREDLEAHFQTPHVQAFRRQVDALADRNEVRFGRFVPPVGE